MAFIQHLFGKSHQPLYRKGFTHSFKGCHFQPHKYSSDICKKSTQEYQLSGGGYHLMFRTCIVFMYTLNVLSANTDKTLNPTKIQLIYFKTCSNTRVVTANVQFQKSPVSCGYSAITNSSMSK